MNEISINVEEILFIANELWFVVYELWSNVDELWFTMNETRENNVLVGLKHVEVVSSFHCHFVQLPQLHSHIIFRLFRHFVIFLCLLM